MERELRYAVNWRVDDVGLRFIADREAEGGAVLHAYDDKDPQHRPFKSGEPQGTLTIGYGHTRTVEPGMQITEKEAMELLRTDIRDAESYVHRFVRVPLTQWQYNAMVSIIFNVGPGRLPGSTGPTDKGKSGIIVLTTGKPSSLLEALNEGKYDVAATWFTAWKATKGFEFGLFRRRIAEMLMFMGLPWTRAYLECKSLQFTMAQAIALGKEELADIQSLNPVTAPAPAPKPEASVTIITDKPPEFAEPAKDELILVETLTPSAEAPVPAGAALSDSQSPKPIGNPEPASHVNETPISQHEEVVVSKNPSSADGSGSSVAITLEPASAREEVGGPLPPVAPASVQKPVLENELPPPKPPIIIAPKQIDPKSADYGAVDIEKGPKNMTDSRRFVGMLIVGLGSLIQVLAARNVVSSLLGAIFFDLSRDPVVLALMAGAVIWFIGLFTKKKGGKVMTTGFVEAEQLLK